MKATKIIGVIILVLVIGVGLFIRFNPFKKGTGLNSNSGSAGNIEYSSIAAPLKINGSSGYKLETINIGGEDIPLIKIPLVTWGGYAALIAANNGLEPNKDSLFYKYGKFVVKIIREENPGVHLQGYANGDYPIIWSTMDMLPLLSDALKVDRRLQPQVFGIFDWSYGDGIVVRGSIMTPKDLKGKRIVTAGNTPSNFFLLWLLGQSNIDPSEVEINYVNDAIEAKDAFIADQRIDACVTWSPFMYDITDNSKPDYVDGARLLITSKDANQLIADCYLTRIDFAREHPEIIEAFSKSMMEGADLFESEKPRVYNNIATLFELQGGPNEASMMLQDVHIANFPENLMFFDLENTINAYKIFFLSQDYYKSAGTLSSSADYSAESVINVSALNNFKTAGLFASQQNQVTNSFNRLSNFNIADLESSRVVLADDLSIFFEAQRMDFDMNLNSPEIQENKRLLRQVAEQMHILGTTIVKLIGHLDTSRVEEIKASGAQFYFEASSQAKLLSKKRAEFIKKILVEQYGCDADRIITEGKGWDMPIDQNDQSKNRRVEVRFFSLE